MPGESRAEIAKVSIMKLTYKHNRPARVSADCIDTKAMAQQANEGSSIMADNTDYPIYYVVKVQVRVWFFWITIWERHCDFSDGDSRTVIDSQANNLIKALEGQDNE